MLARANTSNICSPDLAVLSAALEGDRTYNIGALITRRLSLNGERGATFGGIFASLVIEHLGLPVHPDDMTLTFSCLDLDAMKRRGFINKSSHWGNLNFMLLFNKSTTCTIRLPAPFLFDRDIRHRWSLSEVKLDEYLAQQQFQDPAANA